SISRRLLRSPPVSAYYRSEKFRGRPDCIHEELGGVNHSFRLLSELLDLNKQISEAPAKMRNGKPTDSHAGSRCSEETSSGMAFFGLFLVPGSNNIPGLSRIHVETPLPGR